MIMTFDPEPVDSGFVVIFYWYVRDFVMTGADTGREGGGLGGLPPPF